MPPPRDSIVTSKPAGQTPVERNLAIGLISSPDFAKVVVPVLDLDLLQVPFVKTVCQWAVEYWKQYETIPGKHIQDIFEQKAPHLEEEQVELIGDLLTLASSEVERGEKVNAAFLTDQALHYLNCRRLKQVGGELRLAADAGDLSAADKLLTKLKTVYRSGVEWINPLTDRKVIHDAFATTEKPLIILPDRLGDCLNGFMVREGFVGIMAPEKRGKTFFLTDLALRSAACANNTAFFAVGDQSQRQMVLRMAIRISGRNNLPRYCGKVLIPVIDCEANQLNSCEREIRTCHCGVLVQTEKGYEPLDFEAAPADYLSCHRCRGEPSFTPAVWFQQMEVKPLTWQTAVNINATYAKRMKGRGFRLVAAPNDSMRVADIDNTLRTWDRMDGFIPDVVVVDYADILAPEDRKQDFRHQQNGIWKALRRLSQEWHCLVLTATQTDADSYEANILTLKTLNEDKRKYAHVTAMLGLNQTPQEKRNCVLRVNVILARDHEFDSMRCVTVLQSLRQGRPILDSF